MATATKTNKSKELPPGMAKRGRTYYACFRSGGRLVRRRLSANLREATRLLNELKARCDRADFGLLDNDCSWEQLTSEFLKWPRQSLRNPSDYEQDLRCWEQYQRITNVRQITPSLVMGFRGWRLSQGKSPRTVNRQVGTLQNMLNKAVDWQRIGENPISTLKPLRHDQPTKQRRSLTADEVEALFAASPDYLKPVWRMLASSGIRKGELIRMRWVDVDFDRRAVTIPAAVAKNHREREIPLDDGILEMLEEMRREAVSIDESGADHVFLNKAGRPWRNNLLTRFYAVCKRAGIDGAEPGGSVDIHALRVSFTTLAIEGGAKPKAIQAILGHSTLGLTMGVYARSTERSKRQAIGALPFATTSGPDHVIPLEAPSVRKVRATTEVDSQRSSKQRLA